MRAHALSTSSPSAGNCTRTRPRSSGSLLLVTTPSTSPEPKRASADWPFALSIPRIVCAGEFAKLVM
jgi:hypothetical protein